MNDAEEIQKSPNPEEVSGFLGLSLNPDTEPARRLSTRTPFAHEMKRADVPGGDSGTRQCTSVCDS
jgi:hypothetical protein